MNRTTDMTKGNPYRLIIGLALPLLAANLLQQVYGLVDTMIVGRCVGTDALAAVGCTGALTWLILGFIIGLTQGFSILVSQYFGKKDDTGTITSVRMSMILSLIVGVIITILGVIVSRPLLTMLGTPETIIDDAVIYLEIIMAGSLAVSLYNTTSSILRAFGNGTSPLISIVISTVLNIVLDLIFIVPLGMGVAGAAIATVIAQLVSGIFCYTSMLKIPELKDLWHDKQFDRRSASELMKMGLPVAVMNSITAIGVVVLQGAVDALGSLYVAAYTVASRVVSLADNATVVIGIAISTYAGQNIGAGNVERTKQGVKAAALISLVFSSAIAAVMILLGKPICSAFLKAGEEDVVSAAYPYLLICSVMLWSLSLLFVFRSSLQGIGNTFVPMLSGIIELGARIAVVTILPSSLGFSKIGIAEVSAWFCAMVFLMFGYFREIRRKQSL